MLLTIDWSSFNFGEFCKTLLYSELIRTISVAKIYWQFQFGSKIRSLLFLYMIMPFLLKWEMIFLQNLKQLEVWKPLRKEPCNFANIFFSEISNDKTRSCMRKVNSWSCFQTETVNRFPLRKRFRWVLSAMTHNAVVFNLSFPISYWCLWHWQALYNKPIMSSKQLWNSIGIF